MLRCTGTPRGEVRGLNPPAIESSNVFVLCVCKIYYPSPALIFIKSKNYIQENVKIVQ